MGWDPFRDIANTLISTGETLADTVSDVGEWVGDTASNIGESIGEILDPILDPLGGLRTIGEAAQQSVETAEAYVTASGVVRNYKPPAKSVRVLGVSTAIFHEMSEKFDGTLSGQDLLWKTIDSSTYPDRLVVTMRNDRGFNVYLTSLTIDGFRIMQYSGEAGELIHDSLKRDDDIRRNGETVFEIGNEYIVDATQCAKIADFWYKFLGKKKHMYSLQIPGSAPWYSVGDWYNLQVGGADRNEYIDAVVECYSVDVERANGGIGSTTLLLRDVEDNWSKTTLYATRLATGGSPKRRVNRSNIVTVASSEYDGTYDYKCDGTDDDVQIQAAMDYVSNTFGGGAINLTNGTFNTTSPINIKTNIVMVGSGDNTHIITTSNINLIEVSGSKSNLSKCKVTGKDDSAYSAVQVDGSDFTIKECTITNVLEVNALNCNASGNVIVPNTAGSYISGTSLAKVNGDYIVASSTYTGEYSLRCDGTADDVQIQSAIDFLSSSGGGIIRIVPGIYTLATKITMKDSVTLKGSGSGTIICPNSASRVILFDFGTAVGSAIEDFIIDGDSASITYIADTKVVDGKGIGIAKGITIQNFDFYVPALGLLAYLFHEIKTTSCNASENSLESTGPVGQLHGFYHCDNPTSCLFDSNAISGPYTSIYSFNACSDMSSCVSSNNTSSSGDTLVSINSFNSCVNLSSCSSSGNTTAGASAYIRSFNSCRGVTSCSSHDNSTSGASAQLYSFSGCTDMSSCSSHDNSTSGASAKISSFNSCKRLAVCSTLNNVSALSTEEGYIGCRSVQQCNSTDDSNPYTTSYADSGTTNACADTAAGGYNS